MDSTPSMATSLGMLVLGISMLCSLALNAVTLLRINKAQRREVEVISGFAREEDLRRLERDLLRHEDDTKDAIQMLRGEIATQRTERRADSGQLFEQLRAVSATCTGLSSQVSSMNQELKALGSRLNTHLDRKGMKE